MFFLKFDTSHQQTLHVLQITEAGFSIFHSSIDCSKSCVKNQLSDVSAGARSSPFCAILDFCNQLPELACRREDFIDMLSTVLTRMSTIFMICILKQASFLKF